MNSDEKVLRKMVKQMEEWKATAMILVKEDKIPRRTTKFKV